MNRTIPRLSTRLLRHVLIPLSIAWLVGNIVEIYGSNTLSERLQDRELLSDARLLASYVREEHGSLSFSLSPAESRALTQDEIERHFFAIFGADGKLLGGDPTLSQIDWAIDEPTFGEFSYRGTELRVLSLPVRAPKPFWVVVGQTRRTHWLILKHGLLVSVLPQTALLLLLALWLRRRVNLDLQPLRNLQAEVATRDAADLRPVVVPSASRETRSLAESVNALLARLERSAQSQREFAGNVAHELRTPLAGIRALAEYGLHHDDPAVWHTQLEGIARSEERASRMVDKLLALALAQEAESLLVLGPVQLDSHVQDAVLRFLQRADAAGVDLGALGIDRPVVAWGDSTLIDGILNNLIDNALRYGGQDTERPSITVSVEQEPDVVVLSVRDNGPGVPDDEVRRVLQRGTQGELGQMLGEGVGLGLALVAQYAHLMQATMQLGTDAGGRGWVCSVRLRRGP